MVWTILRTTFWKLRNKVLIEDVMSYAEQNSFVQNSQLFTIYDIRCTYAWTQSVSDSFKDTLTSKTSEAAHESVHENSFFSLYWVRRVYFCRALVSNTITDNFRAIYSIYCSECNTALSKRHKYWAQHEPVCHAAVAQWTKRLTRNAQTRVQIWKGA